MRHTILLLLAMLGSLSTISSQNVFFNRTSNFALFSNYTFNQETSFDTFLHDFDPLSTYAETDELFPNKILRGLSTTVYPTTYFSGLGVSTFVGYSGAHSTTASENTNTGTVGISQQLIPNAFTSPILDYLPIKVACVDEESKLKIYKVNGELVLETALLSLETELDVKALEYGYYIVEYSSKETAWKLPLIKH